jgi:hypothetical protein
MARSGTCIAVLLCAALLGLASAQTPGGEYHAILDVDGESLEWCSFSCSFASALFRFVVFLAVRIAKKSSLIRVGS